jgi:5-methylcytosine-specific restriction endonuclease McrA
MDGAVRYSGNSEKDGPLRAALFLAWDRRCYWCHTWYDVAQIQIDHLIARSYRWNPAGLKKLLGDCLPPEDLELAFDIDAPHNLAPICSPCNIRKSDKPFGKTPRFMELLLTARRKQPEVERRYRAFYARNDLAEALMAVTIAELDDTEAKATLMEFGSLMVNRLRRVSPEVLEIPSDFDYDDPQADEMQHVVVTLDETGRRARVILEDVNDCDFDEVLRHPVNAVIAAINDALVSSMSSYFFDGGQSDPDIGPPVGRIDVEVLQLEYTSPDEFRLRGKFEADGASLASIHANTDSGTGEVQADAMARGTFSLYFEPGVGMDGGDVELTISDDSVWCDDPVWKESSAFLEDFYDWSDEPDDPDEPCPAQPT